MTGMEQDLKLTISGRIMNEHEIEAIKTLLQDMLPDPSFHLTLPISTAVTPHSLFSLPDEVDILNWDIQSEEGRKVMSCSIRKMSDGT